MNLDPPSKPGAPSFVLAVQTRISFHIISQPLIDEEPLNKSSAAQIAVGTSHVVTQVSLILKEDRNLLKSTYDSRHFLLHHRSHGGCFPVPSVPFSASTLVTFLIITQNPNLLH